MSDKGPSVKLSVWLREYEAREGWAPSRNTVIKWIKQGVLVGEQLGQPSKNGRRGGPWIVYPNAKPPKKQAHKDIIAVFEQEALHYEHGQTA